VLTWPDPGALFATWKNNADAIQALVTTIAIVIGSTWAFAAFLRRRERLPHLNVEHVVMAWPVGNARLLHLRIRVTNVGGVIGRLREGKAWVQQMFPLPYDVALKIRNGDDPVADGCTEVAWPLAADVRLCNWSAKPMEVEPGEIDEYPFDFVIPEDVSAVQVYSHLRNHAKVGDVGWNTTSIHILLGGQNDKVTNGWTTDVGARPVEVSTSETQGQVKATR